MKWDWGKILSFSWQPERAVSNEHNCTIFFFAQLRLDLNHFPKTFQSDDRLFSVCPMKVHHYGKTRHTLDRAMLEFYLWFLTCDRLSRSIAKKDAWSQNLYKRVVTGIKMIVGRLLLASCVNNDKHYNHNFDIHKNVVYSFYRFSSIAKQKKSWVLMNHAAAASFAFSILLGSYKLYTSPEANKLSHTHITLKNTFN